MDFDTAVEHVFKSEGGLVDHPKDPGGITNLGISLRAYPHLGREGIRYLTKNQAKDIYKDDYWDAMRCDEIPADLRLMVFDCAVNQGVGYARRALQVAASVPTDGIIGPITLKAINDKPVDVSLRRIADNRYARYRRNKNWNTFGDGWMSRLLSVALDTNKGG